MRGAKKALMVFARYTFLAFSVSASTLGALDQGRSTWELYQRGGLDARIQYQVGEQNLYPDEYRLDDTDDSQQSVTPVAVAYAFVMTKDAMFHRSGCPFRNLVAKLEGFTYVVTQERESEIRTLIIERPTNPFELQELAQLLAYHASIYAFDDGSGFFHIGNTHVGNSRA